MSKQTMQQQFFPGQLNQYFPVPSQLSNKRWRKINLSFPPLPGVNTTPANPLKNK
jgi:hypothetical protein